MVASELIKVQLMTQCALSLFGAIAAQGDLQGTQEVQSGIQKLLQQYGEMIAPFRAIERDEAAERAQEAFEEEKGRVYKVQAIGDRIGKAATSIANKKKAAKPKGRLVRKRDRQ